MLQDLPQVPCQNLPWGSYILELVDTHDMKLWGTLDIIGDLLQLLLFGTLSHVVSKGKGGHIFLAYTS